MRKFKMGDIVEDNGGCSDYLVGTVNEVKGKQIYLKGHATWIHRGNLRLMDLVGRKMKIDISGKAYEIEILREL